MYIPKLSIPSIYATCVYIFKVNHLLLDNQLLSSSLENTVSPIQSVPYLSSILCAELKPYKIFMINYLTKMARISVCFDLYFLVVKDIKHLRPSLPSILFFHLENVHMFFSYLFISSFISWTLSFSVIKFCVLHILILITCWMQSWQIFCAHYVIGYINHSFHFLHFLINNFLNCHNIKPTLLLLYDDTL